MPEMTGSEYLLSNRDVWNDCCQNRLRHAAEFN